MSIAPVPLAIPAGAAAAPFVVASAAVPLSRFAPVTLFVPPGLPRPPRVKDAPPTTPAAITKPKYLRKQIDVQPLPASDGESARPKDANDSRPKPGDTLTLDDSVSAERAAAEASPAASVLRYVVVGAARGKRFGAPSPVLEVPLSTVVPPPGDPHVSYDETSIKLSWTPGAAGQSFRVYRAADGKEDATPLNPAPLTAPAFATAVEFGVERCFVIRAASVRGVVSIESEPSAPACVKAVDTFPPPAPNGLSLLPTEDHNQLTWNAVTTGDLAGYLVMRAEEGTPARSLTESAITETNYTDRTVKSGAHYTYTVVAVDKAGNRSAPSNPAEDIR
jgi:fibronectin type III domain protein